MRLYLVYQKIVQTLTCRPSEVFLCGLLLSVYLALSAGAPYIGGGNVLASKEMTIHADMENLYEAAAAASWSDSPRWWVGPWNYPGVGYYRPLTSMLFLAEQKSFGTNFDAYNRITWLMHGLNTGLLYTLAFLMLRHRPLVRAAAGLIAVYFFATPHSSFFYAPMYVLQWWPAQNDPLCLIWGLTSLIFLQLYLNHDRRLFLWFSLFAFFLAIASKELGHITMPIAICLMWSRRRRFCREMAYYALLGIGMIVFRKLVVPHSWDPQLFTRVVLQRGLHQWLGPLFLQLSTQTYWPAASAATTLLLCQMGFRFHWRWWTVSALSLASACLYAQFLAPVGSWALIFVGQGPMETVSDFVFMLACVLFYKYRAEEPGMAAGALFVVSFVPILNYAGPHYYYWPGAILALADAVFFVCLLRFAGELWVLFKPKARLDQGPQTPASLLRHNDLQEPDAGQAQ